MGGRGSGGGRSGGGGGNASNNPPRLVSMDQYFSEKYSQMTDKELNRAYINSRNLMNKEYAKVDFEQQKLSKMVDEFKSLPNDDPKINEKWEAIDKQTSILNEARSKAQLREKIHYLAVNEKNNVRGRQTSSDIKSMTDGQLNSFYNNSYKQSNKARAKIEKTTNAKTRAKYQKLYEEHSNNFNRAESERNIRGLDGKGW